MNTHVIKKDSWSYKTIQRYGMWLYEASSLCEYRIRLALALLVLIVSWGSLAIFLSTTFIYIVCLFELSSISDVTTAIQDLIVVSSNFSTRIVMTLLFAGQLMWVGLFAIFVITVIAIVLGTLIATTIKRINAMKLDQSLIYKMYVNWKNKICTPISFE